MTGPSSGRHVEGHRGSRTANEGLSRGPGDIESLTKEALGEFSVVRKARSELLRLILNPLEPAKRLETFGGKDRVLVRASLLVD